MKQLSWLLFTTAFLLFVPACKKENDPPQQSASGLGSGRAAIRLDSDKNFNGRKEFEVKNTAETHATSGALGTGTRTIKLEATEMAEAQPTRKVSIDILVSNNAANMQINMAPRSGMPMAVLRMESYSLFGIMREAKSGQLTITRLSGSEIEGKFSGLTDDGMKISGSFAGKF